MTSVNSNTGMEDAAVGFGGVRRLLFASSTGGHLEQLVRIADSSSADTDSVFITSDSAQARSLLAGRNCVLTSSVQPRSVADMLRVVPDLTRIMRKCSLDGVVTTGASIALPAFAAAKAHGIPTRFIESVSRFEGPSVSGRIAASSHLADDCWTQHQAWEGGRWRYMGCVLGDYERVAREDDATGPLSVFVTLGTMQKFRFDRLVDRLVSQLPDDAEVTWQVGCTSRSDLPGETYEYLPAEEFDRIARSADVVVTHAGIGSVLRLLDMGVYPLLVARKTEHGEHVDGHQVATSRALEQRGVVLVRDASLLTLEDMLLCRGFRTVARRHTK